MAAPGERRVARAPAWLAGAHSSGQLAAAQGASASAAQRATPHAAGRVYLSDAGGAHAAPSAPPVALLVAGALHASCGAASP
jgi:hypothetical protein